MQRIRFYVDEHIDLQIVEGLRNRGIDVVTPKQAKTIGASDPVHLARATREKRMLVTRDRDFLKLGVERFDHFGIAFAHHEMSVKACIRKLVNIYDVMSVGETIGQIVYLKSWMTWE